jgi:hypothetical protein
MVPRLACRKSPALIAVLLYLYVYESGGFLVSHAGRRARRRRKGVASRTHLAGIFGPGARFRLRAIVHVIIGFITRVLAVWE